MKKFSRLTKSNALWLVTTVVILWVIAVVMKGMPLLSNADHPSPSSLHIHATTPVHSNHAHETHTEMPPRRRQTEAPLFFAGKKHESSHAGVLRELPPHPNLDEFPQQKSSSPPTEAIVDIAPIHAAQKAIEHDRAIPYRIMQVGMSFHLPAWKAEAIWSWVRNNPEYTHYYFDHQTARDFIERYFEQSHVEAYDVLIPHRFKEEYFTYCWLLQEGGVAVMPHLVSMSPLSISISDSSRFVSAVNTKMFVDTSFIAAERENHILYRVLQEATKHILLREKTECADCVVGSQLLSHYFIDELIHSDAVKKLTAKKYDDQGHVVLFEMNAENAILEMDGFRKMIAPAERSLDFPPDYPNFWKNNMSYYGIFGPNGCRFNITEKGEWEASNRIPLHQRKVYDVAAHSRAKMVTEPRLLKHMKGVTLKPLKVPRRILHTSLRDQVPEGMRKSMEKAMEVNKDFEHVFYSDDRIRSFFTQHFDKRYVKAFDLLIPGAYRSDLFRYCYLYIHGGVYIDIDVFPDTPLSEVLNSDDEFVSAEDNGTGWVYNAFMASIPGHPIIALALNISISRILHRRYGPNPLSITGPWLLRDAFEEIVGRKTAPGMNYGHGIRLLKSQRTCAIGELIDPSKNNVRLFWSRFPTYVAENRWYMPGTHYDTLWNQRKVFARDSVESAYLAAPQSDLFTSKTMGNMVDIVQITQTEDALKHKISARPEFALDGNIDTMAYVSPSNASYLEITVGTPLLVGFYDEELPSIVCVRVMSARNFVTPHDVANPTVSLLSSTGDVIARLPAPDAGGEKAILFNFSSFAAAAVPDSQHHQKAKITTVRFETKYDALTIAEVELLTGSRCDTRIPLRMSDAALAVAAEIRQKDPLVSRLVSLLTTPTIKCEHTEPLAEGSGYHVCRDEFPSTESESCIMASYGEWLQTAILGGAEERKCKVVAFDSGMTNKDLPGRVTLRSSDSLQAGKNSKLAPMIQTVKEGNRAIDMLLIDREGDEWNLMNELSALGTVESTNAIAMEIHLFSFTAGHNGHSKELITDWLKLLETLFNSFDLLSTRINENSHMEKLTSTVEIPCCYKLSLIRKKKSGSAL